ncbi:MAG: TonB-dependent receptor [Opitutus sp.]|nr:TonB-dependent receptor [Opitutus sp.]
MKTNNRLVSLSVVASLLLAFSVSAQVAPAPAPTPAGAAAAAKPVPILSLDPYEVTGTRPEVFSDRNVDLPRTVNDILPYVVFNSKALEESGSPNMEDFLKQNLTMVNERLTNTGNTTSYGASSDISLRGLSTNQTLVLVDGRRMANVFVAGSVYQPDLNGIPMSAVDRVEILPSSASGIYGGSAVAGVINVILKKNYSGGEVRLSYDTPLDTDAGVRTAALSWGRAFENGKTHVMFTAQFSNAHPLRLGDRRDVFEPRAAAVLKNAPDYYWTPTSPFLGAGVNISSGTVANLVLKPAYGGQTLPSNYTYLPAGAAASTATATVGAGILANAGKYNFTLANVNSNGPASNYIFGFTPETKAFSVAVDRKMLTNLDAFVQYNYSSNYAVELYNGTFTNSTISIPAASPTNPFTTAVVIKTPLTMERPRIGPSLTRTFTAGLKARLPKGWLAQFDYTWSQNSSGHYLQSVDTTPYNADILAGTVNLFVDPLLYPVDLGKYAAQQNFTFKSTLNALAARASGALPSLPWGAPTLTMGLESRLGPGQQNGYLDRNNPLTPASSSLTTYFGFFPTTKAAYAEISAPLVARNRIPLIHELEIQMAARREDFKVDTGTPTMAVATSTRVVTYGAPVLNGLPFRNHVDYVNTKPSIGFKYQPIEGIAIRISTSRAFLPPNATQLQLNPLPNAATITILDPKSNTTYPVQTISGGNPNIRPQTSKSVTGGVVWQPRRGALKGLRFSADYLNLKQVDAISTLSAQQIISYESTYPQRVTRNAAGVITQIDTSSINLYKRNLETWDLALDYRLNTAESGSFAFKARETLTLHSKYQFALTAPMYDVAGYPLEGGSFKNRLNTGISWENTRWTATWSSRFIPSYFEYGAAGGQLSSTSAAGRTVDSGNQVRALGSSKVAAQTFHDLVVGYNFGRVAAMGRKEGSVLGSKMFDGLSMQLGLKNVFNHAPAFDTGPFGIGLMSPYGDNRMRAIWMNVKRTF